MGTSVVFVHGLWLHARSWSAWETLFGEQGYTCASPGWPGEPDTVEEAREHPEAVAGYGIADVVDHCAEVVRGLPTPVVAVGHSFGGLVVQLLLGQGLVDAAVALDAAPAKGVLYLPPSALRVASVALRNPTSRGRSVSLTEDQFRYGFGNALSESESRALYHRWNIPSPARPLFEAAAATLNPSSPAKVATKRADRGPLLLVAGGQDHTVPASITRQTYRLYRSSPAVTQMYEFADRGHSLAVDNGWRGVADKTLGWLDEQKL